MPNPKYIAGRRFEYKVRDDLASRGYYVVRAAGSHTKLDLAAFKGEIVLCIQCKLSGHISRADRAALCAVSENPHFVPLVAENIRGGVRYWEAGSGADFDPGEE